MPSLPVLYQAAAAASAEGSAMSSTVSVIAVIAIVAFLAGAASGTFILLVISIHRTSRGPLSQGHGKRGGVIALRILTRIRVGSRKTSE